MKRKRFRKRRIVKFLLIAVLVGICFLYGYAPRFIVEIRNPIVSWLQGASENSENKFTYSDENNLGEFIHFTSFDGYQMEAFVTYNKSDTLLGNIILLHGIRADKELFWEISTQLAEAGFNAIALDLRAHGNSEGTYCTYGIKEKKDVEILIDSLPSHLHPKAPLGIWGFSLGGAVAMQAMAEDQRIQFGLIESTFNSMPSITHSYVKRLAKMDIKPFTEVMIDRAGKIADFTPELASPLQIAPRITQPILMIHGKKDKRIFYKEGQKNFNALGSTDKEFILIEDAYHTTLWKTKQIDYIPYVISFLKEKAIAQENSESN